MEGGPPSRSHHKALLALTVAPPLRGGGGSPQPPGWRLLPVDQRPYLTRPVPLHTHRPEGRKRKGGGGQTWSLWPGGLPEESELQPCGAPDDGLDQVCSQILTESDDTAVVTTDWWWVAVCPSVGG